MFEEIFNNKKPNGPKLSEYGFSRSENVWRYEVPILDDAFRLCVLVLKDGTVDTVLTEADSNEEYVLYKTDAVGNFVGKVREAVEEELKRTADICFDRDVFKSPQTLRLIEYVREKYGDELEYLWKKYENNAVWRRKDNQKWYCALLTTSRGKVDGSGSDETVEIADLSCGKADISVFLSRPNIYPGWHMNKKSWFSVILDGSMPDEELKDLLDQSFMAVGGKNSFDQIYEIVKQIPRGKVATYGQIARLAGNKKWSRVVGYALHVNPEPGVIPCHRVVNASGEPSDAFAFGGGNRQIALLTDEGVEFTDGKVEMERFLWDK